MKGSNPRHDRMAVEEGWRKKMEYELIRSKRRSIGIEVTWEGEVRVRAPYSAPIDKINAVVESRESWIEETREKIKVRKQQMDQNGIKRLNRAELEELANQAVEYIPQRVAFFAKKMGVTYGRITIRNQKSRWGSCSAKGNLNFNCFLMMTPPEVIDYVVVHELCHRKEMNHSKAFWACVEEVLPDYKKWNQWLKEYGSMIIDQNG